MTVRLYYTDSFLLDFDAQVVAVAQRPSGPALVLDHTAFYPESGGQLPDMGSILGDGWELEVTDVQEDDTETIFHSVRVKEGQALPPVGARVQGRVDPGVRGDHMQQHSGQHVLSGAFLRLLHAPTVSFHMGQETCTVDLDVKSISTEQMAQVSSLANRIVTGNHVVHVRFVSSEEAKQLGVRKLPPELSNKLRLIEIHDFDLTACGGTHVSRTGQIGPILLRKVEKAKQGVRVEFVCGERALMAAERDHNALSQIAALYSAHPWAVPEQVRKSLEEIKAGQRERKKLLEEIAELRAAQLLAETPPERGVRLVRHVFPDRDMAFTKLVAHKLVSAPGVVAMLGAGQGQPGIVLAQSQGGGLEMSGLMAEMKDKYGISGGGNRDMAQGGLPPATDPKTILDQLAAKVRGLVRA